MNKSQVISKYKWFVIVKDGCQYCAEVYELLKNENPKFVEISKLYELNILDDIRHYLANDWKTIPMIFYNGEFIGGARELKESKYINDLVKK